MDKLFHVGQVIIMLRKKALISQKELAEKIGKSTSMMSHIEKTGNVKKSTLLSIATALDTTPEVLLNHLQEVKESNDYDIIKLQEQIAILKKENELLWKFLQEKDKVIHLLEQLKK